MLKYKQGLISKMNKKILAILIAEIFLFYPISWASEGDSISPPQIEEEEVEMKVKFYAIDQEKVDKGEFVGTAEIKAGKLEINVTDPNLEKILQEPYITMTGEAKEGVARDWLITYQPGTPEHLQSIAIECYRFGYIGELVKEE